MCFFHQLQDNEKPLKHLVEALNKEKGNLLCLPLSYFVFSTNLSNISLRQSTRKGGPCSKIRTLLLRRPPLDLDESFLPELTKYKLSWVRWKFLRIVMMSITIIHFISNGILHLAYWKTFGENNVRVKVDPAFFEKNLNNDLYVLSINIKQ